jgi:hypothetical protein
MGGTGSVISAAARRRGAEAVTRAGRQPAEVRVIGPLALELAKALEREDHRLAPVAREVAKECELRDLAALRQAERREP